MERMLKMSEVLTWINNYGLLIVVLFIGLVLFVVLYKKNRSDILKHIVLSLVVEAEKVLGSKTGDLKYSYVIDKLYDKLPMFMRVLFSKNEINTIIENSVQKLKEVLSDDSINLFGCDEELYLSSSSNK